MREFVVSKAPQDRVAVLARGTVEDAGGIVSQHTRRVTEFDSLVPKAGDWSRSGYVGTYQNHGEDPVRVRVKLWARWPRMLFLWTLFVGFVQSILFFSLSVAGLSPPPNVWVLAAAVTFAVLGIALIMYASSWADSQELEDVVARGLKERLASDEAVEGHVYTLGEWEEHTYELREEAVRRAEQQAPSRPSTTRKAWKKVTGSVGSTGAGLAQRFRGDDEPDEAEPQEEDHHQAADGSSQGEATEEPDGSADEERSWADRLAFWRGSDDAPEDDDEPEADEATDGDDADAKRERLEELKRQREEEQGA